MRQLLSILNLVVLISAQTYSTTSCLCNQLLSESDCTQLPTQSCTWNSSSNTCSATTSSTDTGSTATGSTTGSTATGSTSSGSAIKAYAEYCDSYSSTDCPQTLGCAWVSTACTHYTGCTPFAKTTDSDCKAMSNRCTTDGTHCVEVSDCSTYTKKMSCSKNSQGKYCYWDTTNIASSVCIDASTCDQLPGTLTTDTLCRAQISICTTTGTGCIDSGTNCSDQTAERSCVWNFGQTQSCYWNGTKCVDRTCDVAATTLITDDACKAFMADKSCTTKAGGGCKTRAGCSDAGIQAACITNVTGEKCYWNSTACVDFTCANAPAILTSNSACSGYLATCITNGAGCVTNTDCTSAIVQTACVKNSSGTDCYWNPTTSKCLEKICTNAASSNISHELCTTFLPTCTVNSAKNGCVPRSCDNALITNITNQSCESYYPSHNCITKNGGGCMTNTTCSAITIDIACLTNVSGGVCFWDTTGSGSCKDKICSNAPDSYIDHAGCQQFSTSCTVQPDGTGCIDKTCGYLITSETCDSDQNGKPCIFKPKCYQKQCVIAPKSYTTHLNCKSYLDSCTVNAAGAGCVPIPLLCSILTQASCAQKRVVNDKGIISYATCYWNSGSCMDLPLTCAARTASLANCEVAPPIGSSGYPLCIWNPAGSGSCVDKTCATATLAGTTGVLTGNITSSNCAAYLPTACLATTDSTACYARSTSCTTLLQIQCQDNGKTTGDCYWNGSSCVDKICANLPTSLTDHTSCHSILNTCTVNTGGAGCTSLLALCQSYTTSEQCKLNADQKPCSWNSTKDVCISLSCSTVDLIPAYNTHTACYNFDSTTLKCTVRASNGSPSNGCMARTSCSNYTISQQCLTDAGEAECEWNLTTSTCADKSCSTTVDTAAGSTYTTHIACQGYLPTCTVLVTITNNVISLLGCAPLAECSSYLDKEACHINDAIPAGLCGWNGTFCADKSCATAPATDYDSDLKCRGYMATPICTVADTGAGCIPVPEKCETYVIQPQCVTDSTGNPCIWDTQNNKCITKSCDNAPEAAIDAESCSVYLNTCTADPVKCQAKICEDFAYNTDALCTAALPTCTSNGINCVLRRTCAWAISPEGCVTQTDGKECHWVVPTMTTGGYCTLKSCATANTTDFTTDSLCSDYFPRCTTKTGGGCTQRSSCTAANGEAACTKDTAGIDCLWDTTANNCRYKACSDFKGSSHAACQKIDTNCTVGLNGFCASKKTCGETTIRTACIKGTDGPCLWVAEYINADNTTGACFSYTECKSLAWTSNTECNWISTNCTTNGSNCVGITLCTETNVLGGCVHGYDGPCLQSVSISESTNPPTCKAYTTCTDVYYQTHYECQAANSQCTTDGTTGCIPLAACQTYDQAGCVFNNVGVVTTSSLITSTGQCTWDFTQNACRDQSCIDFTGTTHAACVARLSTCTSNGTSCITKSPCATYEDETTCGIALGTDGVCFWQIETETISTPICRVKVCSDVPSGTKTSVCQAGLPSCVSDGTICIPLAMCSTYKTRTACNSGGTDGICFFTSAKIATCTLMTSCSSANNDQIACSDTKSRCAWNATIISGTTVTPSSCSPHTCATYQSTNSVCSNFYNWGQTLQQICTLVNGVCKETDPSTLTSSTCFTASQYTYTWSAQTSKCIVCESISTNISNRSSSVNNSATSGHILEIAVMLSYFIM